VLARKPAPNGGLAPRTGFGELVVACVIPAMPRYRLLSEAGEDLGLVLGSAAPLRPGDHIPREATGNLEVVVSLLLRRAGSSTGTWSSSPCRWRRTT
jgi:hypothetical protein